jgi:hypothetical protein
MELSARTDGRRIKIVRKEKTLMKKDEMNLCEIEYLQPRKGHSLATH